MKKYRVYVHSIENGIAQVGKTVHQPCTNASWNATMKGCTKENCFEIKAKNEVAAVKKALQEAYNR